MVGNVKVHGWALWSGAKRPAEIPCFRDGIGGSLAAFLTRRPLRRCHTPHCNVPGSTTPGSARLRKSAFDLVRDRALASGLTSVPLRLAECDPHTLAVWKSTSGSGHPSGWGGWDWEPLLRRAWRHPSSFHLAIWSGKVLCGLAVGRVSDKDPNGRRNAVSIDYIESAHDPAHPLRGLIAFLVVDAAETLGRALQASHLRLVEPLPGVLGIYEQLGFTTVWHWERPLYCERRIEP
jgi:hypothetical protein